MKCKECSCDTVKLELFTSVEDFCFCCDGTEPCPSKGAFKRAQLTEMDKMMKTLYPPQYRFIYGNVTIPKDDKDTP